MLSIFYWETIIFFTTSLLVRRISTLFSLALAALVTEKQYGWSLLANRPILARYLDKLNGVQFVDEIVAQRDGAMQAYLEKKAAEAAAQDQ